MRSRRYRIVTTLERANNRLNRFLLRRGWSLAAFALLETTGRRTGQPRHTPVGNGLDGDTFWIVAVHGEQADFVRNIHADPAVRVKVRGVWRSGTATVLPEDDTEARLRAHPYQWDAAIARRMATAPVTVRVDLRPV